MNFKHLVEDIVKNYKSSKEALIRESEEQATSDKIIGTKPKEVNSDTKKFSDAEEKKQVPEKVTDIDKSKTTAFTEGDEGDDDDKDKKKGDDDSKDDDKSKDKKVDESDENDDDDSDDDKDEDKKDKEKKVDESDDNDDDKKDDKDKKKGDDDEDMNEGISPQEKTNITARAHKHAYTIAKHAMDNGHSFKTAAYAHSHHIPNMEKTKHGTKNAAAHNQKAGERNKERMEHFANSVESHIRKKALGESIMMESAGFAWPKETK